MNEAITTGSRAEALYGVTELEGSLMIRRSFMHMTKKIVAAAMGAAILVGTAGAAFAAPAVATGSVNVRSGPSTQYQKVDTLQRNQVVEVTGCRGGWCYAEKRGPDGWVSANYLRSVAVQSQRNRPSINFSINFGTAPTVTPPRQHEQHWGPGRDRDRDWNRGNDRGDNRGNDRGDYRGNDRNNGGFSFSFGN
jgi:uncharacterized protein YraI